MWPSEPFLFEFAARGPFLGMMPISPSEFETPVLHALLVRSNQFMFFLMSSVCSVQRHRDVARRRLLHHDL